MNIVKELRQRSGMQQKELAISVGVSGPTVSEWEHGKKDPSGDRLRKLSEIFNVDPGVILGYSPLETKTSNAFDGPKTAESRIISACVDKMSQEDRVRALALLKAVYADYFQEGEKMA